MNLGRGRFYRRPASTAASDYTTGSRGAGILPGVERVLLLLLLALSSVAGCGAPPGAVIDRSGSGSDASWPFWPQRMRIHPLTRITVDPTSEDLVIELRLEFTDRDEVTTRAVGQAYLALFLDPADIPLSPVQKWEIDLQSLDANRVHFDLVTRTYLFKLRVEPPTLPEQGIVRAFFASADGREFEDRLVMRR
jgi:hypothetical protein